MKAVAFVTIVATSCFTGCGSDGQGSEEPAMAGAPGSGGTSGTVGAPVASGGTSPGGASAASGGTPPATGGVPTVTGGAPAQSGGSPSSSGGVSVDGGASCPRSTTRGDQVVFLGDSFLAAPTSEIAFQLQALWEAAESPGYSAFPRYHQVVGANIKQIAEQYQSAHQQNSDIKVVILDGGGNDVLLGDRSCLTEAPPKNAACAKTIATALDLAEGLMKRAENDGVEHIVYFFYPHLPTQGLFQGEAPAINATLDYAEPLARAVCEGSPRCTFVSLRDAVGDPPGSGYDDRGYINPGDVHPSPEGSRFFAQVIWEAMKTRCILTP